MNTIGHAPILPPSRGTGAPGLVGERWGALVWIVHGLLAGCCPPEQMIGFGSECPEVMYVPTGALVDDAADCPSDACAFRCMPYVCPAEYINAISCESCDDVDAYREGDGSGCVWTWRSELTTAYCGPVK